MSVHTAYRQHVMAVSSARMTTLMLGILFFLSWTSVLPAAAALVREPYLQLVTDTSVTIVWRTENNPSTIPPPLNESEVQYGGVSGQAWDSWPFTASARPVIPPNSDPTLTPTVWDHIVTITGLTPGTKYFYAVGTVTSDQQTVGGIPQDYFFVTAPSVGTATPFRAWVVGDSGNASLDQIAVRDAMLGQSTAPDLFIHMGDIAYESGTDEEFTTNHFSIYQDIIRHTPIWPTLGNHEAVTSPTAGTGPYYEAHVLPTGSSGTEAYYSFDYGNVHFIVLDSMTSDRSLPNVTPPVTMLDWLESDLVSTSQEWVIAYFHHPPYTKGTHDSDNAADSGGRLTDMREMALGVLEAGGVDLVLAGHSHIYERSFLLDQVYGFGTTPNFVTPDYSTLLGLNRILDPGDGDPSGDGVYQKKAGGNSNDGAVYVVAGHGGKSVGSNFGGAHPVMVAVDEQFGSVLLDVNGSILTVTNLRATETISDTFSIQKIPAGTNVPPSGVIDAPLGDQIIAIGQSLNFTGTGVDPNNNLPLAHLWTFAGAGIPNATLEDPGAITFTTAGVYTVTYTVTDDLNLADPSPATVQITVQDPIVNFTAYNDLAWGPGQLTNNITTITSPNGGSGLPSSGALLDFATGQPTSVSLAVTGGSFVGDVQAAHGANPVSGTDAHSLFNGIVSGQGALSYIDQVGSSLILNFSGLDPSKTYDLAFFGHRNAHAWDRASLITLSGQAAFTNSSSMATDNPNEAGGGLFTGLTDASTRLPADNDNGYVARFSTIDPGSDGLVVLTIRFDGTAGSKFKGKYGSAVRLQESDSGAPTNQAPTVSAGPDQTLTLPSSATLDGTVTDDRQPMPPGEVTTTWRQVSGPGTVTFGDDQAVDTTASFSEAGVYELQLTASDSALTRSDELTITVNPAGGGGGVTISNLVPASYVVVPTSPGLQVGGLVYIDRSYTFTSVPARVQGAAYIQTANNDKSASGNPFLSFTVDQSVTVYVAHDGRLSLPVWLTNLGFTDTGDNLVTSDTSLDLFAQTFPAGLIALGGNESGGSMYSVIVQSGGGGAPTNQAPTVSAGPDQTLTLPSSATLDGTVTDDRQPMPPGEVTTTWRQVSGPGTVTFGDDQAVDTTASFSEAGVYELQLTASDSALTRSDELTITVNPAGGGGGVTISNLVPASYVVVPTSPGLQVGGLVYIDRSYTFTSVPARVQGAAYIQTANNDKSASGNPFLSFTVDQSVTVYVAHDGRLSLPVWLTNLGFTDTGDNLVTSDTSLDLFAQTFPAGLIALGGNESGGSMYSVIVQSGGGGAPTNQAPTVSAGPDQTLTLPSSATLDGTVTDDGQPMPPGEVTTTWRQVSGPGTVTFGDDQAVDTTASFSEAGVYELQLTASDSALQSMDNVMIRDNPSSNSGGFTAYNDLAWGTGQLTTNVTTITSPSGGWVLPSS